MEQRSDSTATPRVEKWLDLPFYTEGPAVDRDGNAYCTTLTGGELLRIDRRGKVSVWAALPCPNGQVIAPNGDHWVCDSRRSGIARFDAHGRQLGPSVDGICAGIKVHTPNDLLLDAAGNLYYTDSLRHTGKVCFLGRDGTEAVVADGLDYPNGLALSRDAKRLFVAESYRNRILSFELEAPGKTAGECRVFAELPAHPSGRPVDNLPDGLTLDADGRLWVAHYGMSSIHCIGVDGRLIQSVDVQMRFPSNLIFMEPGTLLVTGGFGEPSPGALFRVHLSD